MACTPSERMGLPSRSFAADAHDCIMVQDPIGPTEYKGVARCSAPDGELPSDRPAPSCGQHRDPTLGENAACVIGLDNQRPIQACPGAGRGRQRQQGNVVGDREPLAVVPAGPIEDQQGMGRGADLAADLAQMMVHRNGVADRHDDRRRFSLAWADRAKHIGRGEAEILEGRGPAAGLAPHSGQRVLLVDARLVGEPQLDSLAACHAAPTRSNCKARVAETPLAPPRRPVGGAAAAPASST